MSPAQLINQHASHWLAARDAHTPDADEEAAFQRWLDADVRHRVAYLKLDAAWRRSERLSELRPLERAIDPDLLRPPRRRWPLALAAGFVLVRVVAGVFIVQARLGWQHFETNVGGFSRVVLEDGSVMDLNTDSDVRVRLGGERREVRLLRGEGRFQVAHDARRPFVVSAADAAIRAVGTSFSVRLREAARVEVLVSDGTVAIDSAHQAQPPAVHAGETAVLRADGISVSRLDPQTLEQRLAWTSGRLQFRGESLADAVAEFNRYNRRQLRLADASLAGLRVGGSFNATDPDSFAQALSGTFGVRADSGNPDTIVLRPP